MHKNPLTVTVTLLTLTTLIVGCDRTEDRSDTPTSELQISETPIVRSVELSDETGENSVTVVVTADDEAALDGLELDNLILTIGDGSLDDGLLVDAPLVDGSLDAQTELENDFDDDTYPAFKLEVVDEDFAEGTKSIEISENTAPAWRAPFKWRYEYSSNDCVDVTRNSFFHRVWTSIWYKEVDENSDWLTEVTERKLSYKEVLHRCETGSFQLKVGTKARKTHHYTIEFEN